MHARGRALMQVVHAHDSKRVQLEACQNIVKESYACRTFDQNFTHTQLEVLVTDALELLTHCPRKPVRPSALQLGTLCR